MDELARRLIRTWAHNAVALVEALTELDPTWESEIHRLADGWLILSGRDMYINRAMAVGIADGISDDHVDLIVSLCRSAGVQPAIEVTPSTLPGTADRLRARGFVHDIRADVTALVRPIPAPPIDAPDDFTVRPVRTEADLRLWQEVSAAGWGHVDRRARAASDAFVIAAHVTDGDGMTIAFDPIGDRAIGCASLTIRDGLATLGGMSTHPDHRRRGVQAALVQHRLWLAAERGCDQAATTAATGGASERNLRRHGFEPRFTIATWKFGDSSSSLSSEKPSILGEE